MFVELSSGRTMRVARQSGLSSHNDKESEACVGSSSACFAFSRLAYGRGKSIPQPFGVIRHPIFPELLDSSAMAFRAFSLFRVEA